MPHHAKQQSLPYSRSPSIENLSSNGKSQTNNYQRSKLSMGSQSKINAGRNKRNNSIESQPRMETGQDLDEEVYEDIEP